MNFNFPCFSLLRLLTLCWALASIAACSKTTDLPSPAHRCSVVLNGIMHPDSLIDLRLSWSLAPGNKTGFEGITSAKVSLYEDGQLLGEAHHQQEGYYRSTHRARPGHLYRITAQVEEGVVLRAEDRVPFVESVEVSLSGPVSSNPNGNPTLYVAFHKAPAIDSRCWLGVSMSFEGEAPTLQPLLSNSSLLDPFNAQMDNLHGKRAYDLYMRITGPEGMVSPEGRLELVVSNRLSSPVLHLITASSSYDAYLKSQILAYQNRVTDSEGTLNNPLAEPVEIAGNVQGGLGIFAAYATTQLSIE